MTGTNQSFEYNEVLLSTCAESQLSLSSFHLSKKAVLEFNQTPFISDHKLINEACRELFAMHQSHFKRSAFLEGNNQSERRFFNFLESVEFVHRHNSMSKADSSFSDDGSRWKTQHRVALNQFSDMEKSELPLRNQKTSEDNLFLLEQVFSDGTDTMSDENNRMSRNEENPNNAAKQDDTVTILRIDNEDAVYQLAESFGRTHSHQKKTSRHHLHNKDKAKNKDDKKLHPLPKKKYKIHGPTSVKASRFAKKEEKNSKNEDNKNEIVESQNQEATGDFVTNDDNWNTYLNWATEKNPDGVAIVHTVSNQGSCGSCWAFAATGTLEANISRQAGFVAYTKHIEDHMSKASEATPHASVRDKAITVAQRAETDTLDVANLSVQELVDCDTEYDQGCTGGNPLLAFFFIRRYGLTSTSQYPYEGHQKRCRFRRVSDPIVTVKSWGLLAPDHEKNMELVLRYLGPIAVGVNGGDLEFLGYKDGIFNSRHCHQNANHAMLVVGYGEEKNEDGTGVTKYWIARNSWGKGWGEDGYVRMKRGSGKKGETGLCGIAKNPSVALGGSLLHQDAMRWQSFNVKQSSNQHSRESQKNRMQESSNIFCTFHGFSVDSYCAKAEENLTALAALASVLLALIMLIFVVKTMRNRQIHVSFGNKAHRGDDEEVEGVASEITRFWPATSRDVIYGSIHA